MSKFSLVSAGLGQGLGGRAAIVDREPGLRRMALRNRDIAVGRIGPDNAGAEPRQRLRQDAAAAADIENAQAS